MTLPREFELCAETLEACDAAETGGADRIELCSALGEGGVSPTRGFVKVAVSRVSIPVHVLVRPRAGGFVFSEAEFQAMSNDAEDALAAGAAGLVIGFLTADGDVHVEQTARLVELAAGRPVTFHRALDLSRDLSTALETAIALGCSRVLTSGGRPTVVEGKALLERLCARAAGRIRVAAGGGVTLANATSLLEIAGLDLHGSLRRGAAAFQGDALWSPPAGAVNAGDVQRMSRMVHAG